MTHELKTYSIVINWQDGDREQGDYGTVVRAANEEEAEAKARAEMRAFDMSNYGDEDDAYDDREYGSVVECSEGWIWKAHEMEVALRDIIASSDANDHGSLMNAIAAASTLLAQLDKQVELVEVA